MLFIIITSALIHSSTMSSDVQSVIPAEEVCEYTFKVELIDKNKISLVVFNTNTGIKYQTHIEEYSDNWVNRWVARAYDE